MARKRNKLVGTTLVTTITDLTHDGRGVGRHEGKVIFVSGALPGEEVEVCVTGKHKSYNQARVTRVLTASADRVEPRCQYFGVCGGCSFQHLAINKQREFKQQRLLNDLSHIAKTKPTTSLSPLVSGEWGYRRKARLGLRLVPKKGGILIGFREAGTSYITSLSACPVLSENISKLLKPLHILIETLTIPDKIPQIEVAEGDDQLILIFRNLSAFDDQDKTKLSDFSKTHKITVCEQPAGLDTVAAIEPPQPAPLYYQLKQHDVKLEFKPTDFIQVNAAGNSLLIDRVIELMDLNSEDHVLDLFCGIGNFSIPIARYAGKVTGVEGDKQLVARASSNATHNRLENVDFHMVDLQQESLQGSWLKQNYTKLLIDPPRSGAKDIIDQIEVFDTDQLIYVSCNPETLARDAAILIDQKGYSLQAAGIIDMFPHTAHVESLAIFNKV